MENKEDSAEECDAKVCSIRLVLETCPRCLIFVPFTFQCSLFRVKNVFSFRKVPGVHIVDVDET